MNSSKCGPIGRIATGSQPKVSRLASLTMLGTMASACAIEPAHEIAFTAPEGVSIAADNPVVAPAQAVSVFDQVCGAALPDFATAKSRLERIDSIYVAPTGTLYSQTKNLSVKLLPGPDGRSTCSVVYGSSNSAEQIFEATSALGEIGQTSLGLAGRYRDSKTLFFIRGQEPSGAAVTYHNIRLISEL